MARFSFAELCHERLGASDYLAIARRFHTIILDAVAVIAADERDIAQRFIMLIDKSPSKPPMPTIRPVKMSCVAPKNGKEKRRAQGKSIDTTSAPNAPSTVFRGLRLTAQGVDERRVREILVEVVRKK